jgi:hypothetical protein
MRRSAPLLRPQPPPRKPRPTTHTPRSTWTSPETRPPTSRPWRAMTKANEKSSAATKLHASSNHLQTTLPIHKTKIPNHKWRDIVYYNPVARKKLKDGKIEYRVRGTAGGNLLTVTYDVSARTANLEVVKILIHATCSSKRKWVTIDIKDFYLGNPLPPGQY